MNKIEKTFANVQLFSSNIYVADYTLQTGSKKKVTIQDSPFNDIQYFTLQNDSKLPVLAVNFEHNKGFFPSGVRDCECMMHIQNVKDGWLLLCELKYCQENNIASNADEAYDQLVSTWQLMADRKLFNKRRTNSYLNISVPDHSIRAPFVAFCATQDDKIRWMRKKKIHLLGYNEVLVVNEGILTVPFVEI